MRILYVTTVSITMGFFPAHFNMLLEEGHTIELACNCEKPLPQSCVDLNLKVHNISFSRSPFSKSNIVAMKQLENLIEDGHYDIIHTHTPNASACVRLVCRKLRKNGLKVFYTAHGFHFYKGAPLKNWLLYYPVEKICAYFTDVLITINKEDYALAQKKMKAKQVEYVPGVGIDITKFGQATVDKIAKRKELGIPEDATLLLSVGELNGNKNHETVIRAIKDLDVYYIIAGKGGLQEHLQGVIDELGMTDRVKLLGYRRDVAELYQAADVYVLPSIREGLNVSVMEAMASGLPCVIGKIRGNVDLIEDGKGGFLCEPTDTDGWTENIRLLSENKELCRQMQSFNSEKIVEFGSSAVEKCMREIYQDI